MDMFANDCKDFPAVNKDLDVDERKQYIWDIIHQCRYHKNPAFAKLPLLNIDAFKVTE